ncbi:MAG: hypothetical protein OHK0047_17230 [Leptolyngbyaceae cyanobacterium]
MAVARKTGTGTKSRPVFGIAQFREPVAMTGRELGTAIDDAFHREGEGEV